MELPDRLRHGLATLVASLGFVALYLGASLVWWVALLLAVAIYMGALLVIRRRPEAREIILTDRVTAEDVRNASRLLTDAERRLSRAADQAPEADRDEIVGLADEVAALRGHIETDPEDYRSARRLLVSYLPNMLTSVEDYVALTERARGSNRDRLDELGRGLRAYRPALERINQACLENDFRALETEVSALGFQLNRG